MDEPEVPAAALLMSQWRRLTGLLVANGVNVEDLEDEVHVVAAMVAQAAAPPAPRRRLHVVPAAG